MAYWYITSFTNLELKETLTNLLDEDLMSLFLYQQQPLPISSASLIHLSISLGSVIK